MVSFLLLLWLVITEIQVTDMCSLLVTNKFISNWCSSVRDLENNPILKTYSNFKVNFGLEPYLYLVRDRRYRKAITQIRTSSHALEIERGRYTKPKTPVNERLCVALVV